MVKLHTPTRIADKNGPISVMIKHSLKVKKDAPSFTKGDTVVCYIAKYDSGRYAVWTASFINIPNYHVFDSVEELHEHFEENE